MAKKNRHRKKCHIHICKSIRSYAYGYSSRSAYDWRIDAEGVMHEGAEYEEDLRPYSSGLSDEELIELKAWEKLVGRNNVVSTLRGRKIWNES